MVARHQEPSLILQLCCALRSGAHVRAAVEGLRVLARQEHALELRLAMVLAWLKRQDPADLGYSSFAALCRENIDWRRSWTHALLRLVESPHDELKRAACAGRIPLRVAVQAAGAARAAPREQVTVRGEDALVVRQARRLGRLLLGRDASDRAVDDTILKAWRERTPAEALLASARAPLQPPPQRPPLDWRWYENPEVDSLIGPWAEPTSPPEALAEVERIQALLRGRRAVLAKAFALVHDERGWRTIGFESGERFANEILGVSLRTAQRLARAGRALASCPELDEAIRSGLHFGAAYELAPLLDEGSGSQWVAMAQRVGRRELGLAVAEAQRTPEVCARYRAAIEAAREVETTLAGPLLVALPHLEPEGSRDPIRVPPHLVEACRWLLAHVRLPTHTGFARVKQRDGHRSQNPECGRLSLRNQAHHLRFVSLGGGDDLENGVTVCVCCHLRAIHTGRIVVEAVVAGGRPAILWRFPGRAVLQLREVPMA